MWLTLLWFLTFQIIVENVMIWIYLINSNPIIVNNYVQCISFACNSIYLKLN